MTGEKAVLAFLFASVHNPVCGGGCRTKRPGPNRRSPIRPRALLGNTLLNPIDPRTKSDGSQMRMTPSGAGKLHPANGLGRPTSRDRRKKKHREAANSQRMQIPSVKIKESASRCPHRPLRYHLILDLQPDRQKWGFRSPRKLWVWRETSSPVPHEYGRRDLTQAQSS